MKKLFAMTAAVAMTATAAFAAVDPVTTQAGIVGPSGVDSWPVIVRGVDGQEYVCKAETQVMDGVEVRQCRGNGGLATAGNGAAIAGGVGAILLLALALDDSSTSTTTGSVSP
ncbi:MAG: hypothetical protein ACSHWS_09075 [Sulfitobacter sp.]